VGGTAPLTRPRGPFPQHPEACSSRPASMPLPWPFPGPMLHQPGVEFRLNST